MKKYNIDELLAVIATLPESCTHYIKYDGHDGIELELIKTETGEWQDVTPEPTIKHKKNKGIESLEAQLAALKQRLSEVRV